MLRHHELLGDELHNAKISIEPPTRSPAYPGETVFDGTTLWIATGITANSWTRSMPPPPSSTPPPFFSWSIDLDNVLAGVSEMAIYFSAYDPDFPNFLDWRLVRRYVSGVDLPRFQSVLNLNNWIEQRGIGLYMPIANNFGMIRETKLEITAANPSTAATLFPVGRFIEPVTNRIYSSANALRVHTCQASFTGKLF